MVDAIKYLFQFIDVSPICNHTLVNHASTFSIMMLVHVQCITRFISARSCYRSMKCRAILVREYRMTLSQVKQGFCRCANGSNVRYRRGTAAPIQLVSPRLGVLSWRGDAGRPGDKYPFDIMDGVCIQPQRNGGTNPIRFGNGSAGAHA